MKAYLSFLIISIFLLCSCNSVKKDPSKNTSGSIIEFEATTFDFGKIAFGSDGSCVFRFTNTSETPLMINKVRTSCGCTNPSWYKDPVEQGKSGEIFIKYNTQIPGKFQKSITVFSNAVNSPVKLLIKGEVEPDPSVSSTNQ